MIRIAYDDAIMAITAATAGKAHLAQVLRWSAERDVAAIEAVAAGLGMATPVAIGAGCGHLAAGLAASLGGLVVGDAPPGPSTKLHLHRLAGVLAPAVIATIAATLAAGHGWLTVALGIGLAVAAATVGGYSRGLAVAALRFVLVLVLTGNAADATAHPAGLLVLVLAGALGAAAISFVLGALPGPHRRTMLPPADPGAVVEGGSSAGTSATSAQKYARWKRMLAERAGWQYALRLAGCLGIAAVARHAWPDHHLHWIALVVAILTQRQLEPLPIKATQRSLGTVLGVAAASLVVAYRPPIWLLVAVIGVLAGLRPLLKARSYLAYTAVITPLIFLIMGADRPLGAGLLLDRLIATLAGAGLVVAANLLAARWLAALPKPTAGAGRVTRR